MRKVKLRQLECLCEVVDAGFNISRSAGVLHATQPAIGKQLRQLEEDLGVDLLLRQNGRPVALTDVGERTLVWARRALQCADNIGALAREGGGESGGIVTLATSHTHANYLLLPALVAFRHRFPQVHFNVLQGMPQQVEEHVRDGEVAIGVTHLTAEPTKEVVAVPFHTSRRVLVMPAGHPLLKQGKLTLERIAAYPVIVQHYSSALGSRILDKFQQAGLDVNVVVQALDADVIKTYVACGLGIGIIPAFCYSARKDRDLLMRDVGHLFDPAVTAVLLRRHSHLQKYIYQFLAMLDPTLEPRRLEALVFQDG